jgi:Xaa-Pro aminopeptidase
MTDFLQSTAIKKRLERFQETLAKKKIKAAIISNPIHYRYLLGPETESESIVFIPTLDSNRNPIIFTNPLEAEMLKKRINPKSIDIIVTSQALPPKILKELNESKYKELESDKQSYLIPNSVLDAYITKKNQEKLKKILDSKELGLDFPGWDGKQEISTDIRKNLFKTTEWNGKAVLLPKTSAFQYIGELLSDLNISLIGIESSHLNYQNYLTLKQTLKKTNITPVNMIDIEEILTDQRIIKDPDEIATIREACRIGDLGFTKGLKTIHEGGTELDVVADIEYTMKKAKNEKPSFPTIVVSGYKSAWPHGQPDEKVILKGESVTVDLGAVFQGYCSDMTRTVIAGNEGSEKIKEIFQIVNGAFDLAVAAAKPGLQWSELDTLVRKYFKDKGVLDFYPHSLGHGVGIEVHETPWISHQMQEPEKVLVPGMVITIEPGLYKPDIGGVRTENTYLITADGAESLCKSEIIRY